MKTTAKAGEWEISSLATNHGGLAVQQRTMLNGLLQGASAARDANNISVTLDLASTTWRACLVCFVDTLAWLLSHNLQFAVGSIHRPVKRGWLFTGSFNRASIMQAFSHM